MIFDLEFAGFGNDLSQKFENQLYKNYLDRNSRVDNFTKQKFLIKCLIFNSNF